LERLSRLDRRIVAAAKDIKVLSRLSWPAEVRTRFLEGYAAGNPVLPAIDYPGNDLDETISNLAAVCGQLEGDDHPLPAFLLSTANSYITLCRLLQNAGTRGMLEHSLALYGGPRDPLSGGQLHSLEAAEHFLEVGEEYYKSSRLADSDYCLSARIIQSEMSKRLEEVFEAGVVKVVIDPKMASKAAAGATQIRLRDGTCFSEYDLEQLLQHEAFVHSLTALNGRAQTQFKSLSLGAPRTTGAQEGLATFSELVTGAIDISRMERIALRVVAIDMALSGADFIEVFRYFINVGQSELESFSSAMRIFRGAPLTGGAAFTKDTVYLHGLMEVHTFFRWAMHHQRLSLCRHFFSGRMTISDVIQLEHLFEDGTLSGPRYLPPWMVRTNGLAGYLAFSVFANRISISELGEEHKFDRVSDMEI
jgi:uncharacterized protein (TIGR02421 family)